MITTPEDYKKLLSQIQDSNYQKKAILLPIDEPIYEIDLSTRKIQAPAFLGVTQDHQAEIVYFKTDRYFDNIDLSTTNCIIQYINKNASAKNHDEGYFYIPPYIDTQTFKEENKILFPWVIKGYATSAEGLIDFSIKFYKTETVENEASEVGDVITLFELNTLPATSKVLKGLEVIAKNDDFSIPEETVLEIYNRIKEVSDAVGVYWIDAYGEEGEE